MGSIPRDAGSRCVIHEICFLDKILLTRPDSLVYPIAGYTKIEMQPLEGGDVDA